MRNEILDAMGVQQWLPRIQNNSLIVSEHPIFSAACLVILPENPANNPDQNKILTGMLNVLNLNADELCIAWLQGPLLSNQIELIGQEIAKWSPFSILIMDESLGQLLTGLNAVVQVTTHPAVLLQSPDLKAKAYRDLLNLRDKISAARLK